MEHYKTPEETPLTKQFLRQQEITTMVMAEGTVRIDQLAKHFDISQMTVHRDLDELEERGLLRKTRGAATALASSLVESSDIYRMEQQHELKVEIAKTACSLVEPGQAIFLDDSTTVIAMAEHLQAMAPLTVITNVLTLMNELRGARDISVLSVGGTYHNWCSSFMGGVAIQNISQLRADAVFMSTAAIVDDICFHQNQETVDIKRAMFNSAKKRYLLVDHTKFQRRAMFAFAALADFDAVIVDSGTPATDIGRLREAGTNVIIARASAPTTRQRLRS
ncbi:DeoR/GlpR family DNA-binding transcription regulator [Paeniglutamicibacter sp. MACA_103]|uniref:DeoR/GlpR family DNA-binding transcription regulator n=1 Tax=Paeniglutamicibacter sp. MACA_103 TaxID=3377337 RepID=UPI003896600B